MRSTDCRFMKYQFCRLLSASSAHHAILALSLTAGCQWPTTWRQSVTIDNMRQIRPTLQSLSRNAAMTLVQAFVSSRLDYCNSVLYGVTDNLLQRLQSVRTERNRQVNDADGSPWTHLTSSAGIALAACPTLCGLQTGNADVQVATRLHTVVSLRRLQVSDWGQSPSPLVWRHHMRHTVVQNSSGRQVVWCRRTAALEQVACFTVVIWQSLPIQKTIEDVFVCQGLGCGA